MIRRNFRIIEIILQRKIDETNRKCFEREHLIANSSRVKWINWKKRTSDREDMAQSKRRMNMIVETTQTLWRDRKQAGRKCGGQAWCEEETI
jgi:hypothetical protein